jgi:hypothetical protein
MCNVNRWFYRCTDCLTVTAANENLQQQWDRTRWAPAATCGLCGGPVENMGQVEGPRLIKEEELCTCDERCTHAKGPKCSCKCGGEFHGQGCTVTVKRDCGPLPVLCNPDNAKAAAIAAEFREALAPLVAERDRIDRKREQAYNGWLERSDFDRHRELCRLIGKARESRTHTNRMKIIRAASIQETVA